MVEQRTFNPWVQGSSPWRPTNKPHQQAPPTKSQVNAATLNKLPAGVPAKQPGWHQEIHGREMLASHSCPGDLAGVVAAACNR
jgi:hypothetical protein